MSQSKGSRESEDSSRGSSKDAPEAPVTIKLTPVLKSPTNLSSQKGEGSGSEKKRLQIFGLPTEDNLPEKLSQPKKNQNNGVRRVSSIRYSADGVPMIDVIANPETSDDKARSSLNLVVEKTPSGSIIKGSDFVGGPGQSASRSSSQKAVNKSNSTDSDSAAVTLLAGKKNLKTPRKSQQQVQQTGTDQTAIQNQNQESDT